MSDLADYISLIAWSVLAWTMRILDILSSREMTKWGIKEENWYAQGKGGKFSEWKGWMVILIPFVLVYVAFFAFDQSESYDRFWAPFFLITSAGASFFAYRHNWRLIRNRKERMISPGGLK